MLKVYLLYYAGLLPFAPLRSLDLFGFPADKVDYARVRENLKSVPSWLCRGLAAVVGGEPAGFFLCPKLVAHLRARGVPVLLLGGNNDEALKAAVQVGASAVLTDRPTWLTDLARSQKRGLGLGVVVDTHESAARGSHRKDH
mmetsp:Transcript_67803/g.116510  ORF Transcript_67803/g.116510 Transcript_67803/m.116510 type:complete len:142 (+) Transcript_67803:401-826(+)